MKLTLTQISDAAAKASVALDPRDGIHQVSPGVYLFTGCDLTHRHKRSYQFYAVHLGEEIRIERPSPSVL